MTAHVYVYHNGQPNIPQLTAAGGAGQLEALLYAIGVTGFCEVTLDSLTQTGGVATATRSAGLNLADGQPALYVCGPPAIPVIVKITAPSDSAWDGVEASLNAIPGATSCTFLCSPSLPATCAGPVTIMRAPAGMTRLASAANQSIWQFKDTITAPFYVMLDDSSAQYAGVRLAESAAAPVAYGTMAGLCPTVAQQAGVGGYITKAGSSGGNREFLIVAWKGGAYICIRHNIFSQHELIYLGSQLSRKAGDSYPGIIIASTASNYTAHANANSGAISKNGSAQAGQWMQRTYSQAGSSIVFTKLGDAFGTLLGGPQSVDNTNTVEGGADELHGPIHLCEGSAASGSQQQYRRGILPGLWDILCSNSRITLDVLSGMSNLAGRRAVIVKTSTVTAGSNYFALDIDGPYSLADY